MSNHEDKQALTSAFRAAFGLTLALSLTSCSGDSADPVSNQQQRLGTNTFMYLRCNATGWGVDDSTRLESTADPDVFTLSFEVDESWMVSSGDQCTLWETNQYNGWGNWQRPFTKVGTKSFDVPGTLVLEPGAQYFDVVYPEQGEYTATLNWATSTLTIEASNTESLTLEWPLQGEEGVAWVVQNYVDLDPSTGILDYLGGSKSYDGHRGVDIDVPTFRAMDNDVPILAAAGGTVIGFYDDNFDRNTECIGDWNFVSVRSDLGHEMIYGHLKQDSVAVAMGQRVEAGDVLGVVGSSGCSSGPHLHLEIYDAEGALVDPFLDGMWNNPPAYDTAMSVMDIVVTEQGLNSVEEVIDPVANETVFTQSDSFSVGVSLAGGEAGQVLTLQVLQPGGSVYFLQDIVMTDTYRHTFWYWNWNFDTYSPVGDWTLEVVADGELERSYPFEVEATD